MANTISLKLLRRWPLLMDVLPLPVTKSCVHFLGVASINDLNFRDIDPSRIFINTLEGNVQDTFGTTEDSVGSDAGIRAEKKSKKKKKKKKKKGKSKKKKRKRKRNFVESMREKEIFYGEL